MTGGKSRFLTGWVLANGYLKYERWNWPAGSGVTDVGAMLFTGTPFMDSPPNVTQLITYSGYPNGNSSAPATSISDFGARISPWASKTSALRCAHRGKARTSRGSLARFVASVWIR